MTSNNKDILYRNSRIILVVFTFVLFISLVIMSTSIGCTESCNSVSNTDVSASDIVSNGDIVSDSDIIVLEMEIIEFNDTKNVDELKNLISMCDERIKNATAILEAGKALGYDNKHPVITLAQNEIIQATELKNQYDKTLAEELSKIEAERKRAEEEARKKKEAEERRRRQEEEEKKAQSSTTNTTQQQNTGTYLGRFKLTAYCNCSKCCGKWAGGATKSGTIPKQGRTIAVDPSVIPLGTKVQINGHVYTAEDTGSAIKGKKIDIYFDSHQAAINFGVQYADVYIA